MPRLLRVLPLLLASACGFDATLQSGAVSCGGGGECPGDFECCDGVCVAPGECGGGHDMGPADQGGDQGACAADADGDGVCDPQDNCPSAFNPGQGDCDGNGAGDACDPVYEAQCFGLRATLSSGGGLTRGADDDLVGVIGESSHSVSGGHGYRLRGGLLPAPTEGP